MTDLSELLERVRAATGPDRELDEAILKHLGFHAWAGRMSYHDAPMQIDFGSSEITASIDAALALTERVLPKNTYKSFELVPAGWWQACVDDTLLIKHKTAPLAILAATLSALIAKEA